MKSIKERQKRKLEKEQRRKRRKKLGINRHPEVQKEHSGGVAPMGYGGMGISEGINYSINSLNGLKTSLKTLNNQIERKLANE